MQDDDEADTVGCCSLKVEHVALCPPTSVEVRTEVCSLFYNLTSSLNRKVAITEIPNY
mgnify:CR=1 FL=1